MCDPEQLCVIYALSLDGGPDYRYVGLTSRGATVRLSAHRQNAPRKADKMPLYKWMSHHGPERVQATVLEVCERDDLQAREVQWIADMRAAGYDLLNVNAGGSGFARPATAEETRRKLSASQKALWTPQRRLEWAAKARETMARPGVMEAIVGWHTPERRAEQGAKVAATNRRRKGHKKSDAWREASRVNWEDPEWRKRRAAMVAASYTPERRRAYRERNHVRWHVNREMRNPECEFCAVTDLLPDEG